MARLITGRLNDADELKRALSALEAAGFDKREYGAFYVSPPGQHHIYAVGGDTFQGAGTEQSGEGAAKGAALGGAAGLAAGAVAAVAWPVAGIMAALAATGVGAYVGSLMGAMSHTRHPRPSETTVEHPTEPQGGLRLAINVDRAGTEDAAREILRNAGAESITEAEGDWHDRQWQDFDPRVPPEQVRH